jgi:hypothetical protein
VTEKSRRHILLYAIILFLIIAFEYGKAFDFYFVGDDFTFITMILQNGMWGLWNPGNFHACHFYPVGILLNALPASFGIFEPRYFALVNFLLYYSCSLLVVVLYRQIAGNGAGGFLAALIFATAVPNSEVIYWKTGTQTIGMALFSVLALVFYIEYLRKSSWPAFVACFVAYALAILCIEQGALAIGMLGLYDVIFHAGPAFISSEDKRREILVRFICRYLILLLLPLLLVAIKLVYSVALSPVPWDSRDISSIPWLVTETITKLIFLTNTILPDGSSPWTYRVSAAILVLVFLFYIYKKRSAEGAFFLIASMGTIVTISVLAWGPHSRYYCLPLVFYACFLVRFLYDVTAACVRWYSTKRARNTPESAEVPPAAVGAHLVLYWVVCLAIALAGLRGSFVRRDYWETASLIERNAAETVEDYFRSGVLSDELSRRLYLLNVPDFIWSEKYSFIYVASNSLLLDIRHRIGADASRVLPIADDRPAEITVRGKTMMYVKLGDDNSMSREDVEQLARDGHLVLAFSPAMKKVIPFGAHSSDTL